MTPTINIHPYVEDVLDHFMESEIGREWYWEWINKILIENAENGVPPQNVIIHIEMEKGAKPPPRGSGAAVVFSIHDSETGLDTVYYNPSEIRVEFYNKKIVEIIEKYWKVKEVEKSLLTKPA